MKKFRFSLTTLLQVRREKENIARKNLLEEHLVLQDHLAKLIVLVRQRQQIIQSIREKQKEKLAIDELSHHFDYLQTLKKKIDRQFQQINEVHQQLEVLRQEVLKAVHQRKIIENLRDKKLTEWETKYLEQERAFFDELATIRFARKQKQ